MQPPPEKRQKLDNTIVQTLLGKGIIKQLKSDSQITCSMCNYQIKAADVLFKNEYGYLIDSVYEAFLLLWHCSNSNTKCSKHTQGWTYTVLVGNKAEKVYVGQSRDVLRRLTEHQNGTGADVTKSWGGLFGVPLLLSATAKLCLHDVAHCLLDLKINPDDGLHPDAHEQNQAQRVFNSMDPETAKQSVRGGYLTQVTPAPKDWRKFFAGSGRCNFCMEEGHMVRQCPKMKKRNVSTYKFVRVGLDEQSDSMVQDEQYEEADEMSTHDSEDGENEFIEDDDYGDVVPNPEQSNTVSKDDMKNILNVLFAQRLSKDRNGRHTKNPPTIPKQSILEIGYFTNTHASPEQRPDDGGWQSRFSHFKKIRPLQQKFTKCVKDAIDGSIPQRTFFFASGTSGGKTHAIVEAAINTCLQTTTREYSALIIAPQRNVVEDICRGHFSKLTAHKTGITVKNGRLAQYESNITDNGHILLGGDIDIDKDRKVRWCMFSGHGDIHELKALQKDKRWTADVDIFIGTVDAIYIKPLPEPFLKRLRCVFIDEVHMFRNSLGENTSYLLRMLHISRNRATNEAFDELVIGMATATCGDPKKLAKDITKRQNEPELIKDGAYREYKRIFGKHTLRNETCGGQRISVDQMYKVLCNVGDVGNLMVFYESAVDEESQIVRIFDRKRNMQPTHSSAISFHDSKKETIGIEACLRRDPGDHRDKYFSYNSSHAKLARVLRAGDASGKTMIATSAGSIGQHIPNTCIVCIELCPDHGYLLQAAGRGGRDCLGITLVRCKPYDPKSYYKVRGLTQKVVDDPGQFFNRDGRRTVVSDSHTSFYKNAAKYLLDLKRNSDDHWKTRFLQHMFIPDSCKREAEGTVGQMDLIECIDYFIEKFAENGDIPPHQIKSALTAARTMDRVIKVFEDGDPYKTTLAHITTLEAFKNYFPGSLNRDVYEPHKTLWKWKAVNCLMRDDKKATIDDIISIVVSRIDKGSTLPTEGYLCKHDATITSPASDPLQVDIPLLNGKQHRVQIQKYKAQQIHDFCGYSTIGHSETPQPPMLTHPEIDNFEFWKAGAKHVAHMEALVLKCAVPVGAVGKETGIQDAVRSRIEDIFYASEKQISLKAEVSRNINESHELTIHIIETRNDYNVCNGLIYDDNNVQNLFQNPLFSILWC